MVRNEAGLLPNGEFTRLDSDDCDSDVADCSPEQSETDHDGGGDENLLSGWH
jgi:hypothetical protein